MVRGKDVGHFHKVVEIFASGLCFGLDTFDCRQPSGLNFKFGMSLFHKQLNVFIFSVSKMF